MSRITQRNVFPLSSKFRLAEYFDAKENNIDFKDDDGNSAFKIELSTGIVTFGTDLTLPNNVTITGDLTATGAFDASGTITNANNRYITSGTEFYMPISIEHTFTGSASYLDNTGTSFALNADDFPGFTFAYQSAMSVETGGRTAYSQLYNITDVTAVVGSEITSTDVGITNHDPTPVRSGGLTFPSGEKEYVAQRKQVAAGNGGDNMHMYLTSLVFIKT